MPSSEAKTRAVQQSALTSNALLLCSEETTAEDQNITRVLEFLAIPWKAITTRERDVNERQGTYAVVSSAHCLVEAMQHGEGSAETLPAWIAKASTVYIYGFQYDAHSTKLLRLLTGNPHAKITPVENAEAIMTITGDAPQMCGPMSGLRVPVTLRAPGCVCDVGPGVEGFQTIVRADEGEIFFAITCAGVRFYLNTWSKTLDISALTHQYFDVKKNFCEAVPLIFYLKWAMRDVSWKWGETSACLIVDDPALKRQYGFMNFAEALDLMHDHNFTTTLAFIPWNWRRTHASTLSLFQSHPERLSVVVHGCDHTTSEFAVRSTEVLNHKIRTSTQRMESFRRRASITAERIMVFPQGEFSPEVGRALKLNGFVAAVNTEVAPALPAGNETTIADVWSLAILKYGTFPIFTRRYLDHGIENFAFDALLGKPCLIAAHHDVFRDHARNLVDFVDRLNALKWNLVWRPLGEAIHRCFATRRLDGDTSVIQMFATILVVENSENQVRKMLLLKKESDPDCIEAVCVNQARVEFTFQGEYLRVWLTMYPGENAVVRIVYRNDWDGTAHKESSRTDIRVAAKRYLSEFRDNYISRSDLLY